MNQEKYTPKEIAELEKSRTISDAEFLKEGAEYAIDSVSGGKRLKLSEEQIERFEIEKRDKEWHEKEKEKYRKMKELMYPFLDTVRDEILTFLSKYPSYIQRPKFGPHGSESPNGPKDILEIF